MGAGFLDDSASTPLWWVESASVSQEAHVGTFQAKHEHRTSIGADGGPVLTLSIREDFARLRSNASLVVVGVRDDEGGLVSWQPPDGEWEPKLGDRIVAVGQSYLDRAAVDIDEFATYVRRWAATGMDAYQLRDSIVRTGARRSGDGWAPGLVAVWWVRRRETLSVWSGPPQRSADDATALDSLMRETGRRVICGGTTAEIAARLLDQPLRWEQVPRARRTDVPPAGLLEGIDLVTEGLVTLERARDWIAGAETWRDLPGQVDAATRLARLLLRADHVKCIVGGAMNPVQLDQGGLPRRLALKGEIIELLKERNKVVEIIWL
jgi:hypothetical protein